MSDSLIFMKKKRSVAALAETSVFHLMKDVIHLRENIKLLRDYLVCAGREREWGRQRVRVCVCV